MKPADCKDVNDVRKLSEQSIGINEDSLSVCPNYVLLTIGQTTIKIGMNKFKAFAEWYLTEQ